MLQHSNSLKRAALGTKIDIGIISSSLPHLLSRSWLLETPATRVSVVKRVSTLLSSGNGRQLTTPKNTGQDCER